MNELEKIIARASCPCRDEECQRELAHIRRAVREALGLVTTLCDRYDNEQALDTDWLIDSIRALAATLDKGEKP